MLVLHKYAQTMSKASLEITVLAILQPNTHSIISSQPHSTIYLQTPGDAFSAQTIQPIMQITEAAMDSSGRREESPSETAPLTTNHLLTHRPCAEAHTPDNLELLRHLEDDRTVLLGEDGNCHFMLDKILGHAPSLPYLMDQLLAISALHLSTLPQQLSRKSEHLFRAAQLHDRALAAFHAADAAPDGGLDTCLFYSLWSLQCLGDTLSFCDHFSGFMDRFVRFVSLQQRCRHTVQGSSSLRDSPFAPMYQTILKAAAAVAQGCGTSKYDKLSRRLGTACLDPVGLEACRAAVKHLQWMSDVRQQLPVGASSRAHLLMAWPALIPDSFVELIEQRRPEALVVIAHYAAMLRSCTDFWVFASSGAALERLITRHLGPFWEGWLYAAECLSQ